MVLLSPMEASSSSCSGNFEYHVFLSFRGEDVRDNFLSHLYLALRKEGIITFKDDRELERGESIEPSLLKAIQKSKIALVVFSPNYASSSWCLDELAEIARCRVVNHQIIFPVFFKVDPSYIQTETGIVAEAFKEHELNFKNDKIQTWRDALSTIAALSGWDAKRFRDEATLIEHIVEIISKKILCDGSCFEYELVGIDSPTKEVLKLMDLKCNEVRMVGIWGTGGIGKTTMAEVILHRYGRKFEACCILKNIKERAKREGLSYLQREFISQIFPEETNAGGFGSRWDTIHTRLRNKKVLIVLDDIDNRNQLNTFARKIDWFGKGSRIIITTRDKQLLISHGVHNIYEVKLLVEHEALQLFSLHAFKKNQPPDNFLDLSKKIISYAKGLPLGLEVLGASLCSKKEHVWHEEFEKLKEIPKPGIIEVLKTSLDGLDYKVKAMFFDIALFFEEGYSMFKIKLILRHCGFYPERDLDILQDKALLKMVDGRIWMHDLIRQMAYEVVREDSKDDVNKQSRVCHPDDAYFLLKNWKGSKEIEGISVNMEQIEALDLHPDTFTSMFKLKILKFYGRNDDDEGIQLSRGLSFLPETLRYICWYGFPAKSLPSNFLGKNLVALKLHRSEVEHLFSGDPELMNLVSINLSNCKCLKMLPSLSKAAKIVEINLYGCESFIGFSRNLQHLESLNTLVLIGCTQFEKLPKLPQNLVRLELSGTGIKELSSDILELTKLESLDLSKCKNLSTLPMEVGAFESLTSLCLYKSGIRELPESIVNLLELYELYLSDCAELVRLPKLPRNLVILCLSSMGIKELSSNIVELTKLESLGLSDCKNLSTLPADVDALKSLEQLFLCGSGIKELPESIVNLHKLHELYPSDCAELVRLPKLPRNPKHFDLFSSGIKELPSNIVELIELQSLDLRDCKNLSTLPIEIGALESLEFLDLSCSGIRELPESIVNLLEIKELNLAYCVELVRLPSCLHEFSSLERIYIGGCKSLCLLPELPPWLKVLDCGDCYSLETLPDIGLNGELRELDLTNCNELDRKAGDEVMKHCEVALHSHPEFGCGCRVPGEEIPDWFEYKSGGSSITIRLPPSLDQIKRSALSLVVGPHDQVEYTQNAFSPSEVRCNQLYQLRLDSFPRADHVIVWTPWRLDEFEGLTPSSDLQFDFTISPARHQLVIKKCGVHLITDVVEAFPTVPSSSHDDPTQRTQKRKAEEGDTADESSKAKRR